MSLEKTDLRELVKDLVEIGGLVEEAQESRSVHAPPEIRARGKAQLPILLKCELLLSDELHRRLGGYSELAEVAIDAMEMEIVQQETQQLLSDIYGPLEIEEREAEEREALGCTIADIEEAELKRDEKFEAEHPGVLVDGKPLPGVVYDLEMLYTVRHHNDMAIAKEEARRRAIEQAQYAENDAEMLSRLRATGADGPALEFHKPRECIRISPDSRSTFETPKTLLHIREDGEWDVGRTPPTHKLDVYSLGLPKCLQSEDHDPLLWAMKEAAWASLQRLETDVLVEYLKLWVEKHHDYGVENHAIWGCQGAIIRATDKLMRLKGTYFDGREMKIVENDWLDLIGYGLIGIVIERGQWPVMALEEVLGRMQTHYAGDDAFEHVMGDMKAKMEKQSIRCNSCGGLGQEPHPCPYQRALHGNPNPEYCTCCEDCETRCQTRTRRM